MRFKKKKKEEFNVNVSRVGAKVDKKYWNEFCLKKEFYFTACMFADHWRRRAPILTHSVWTATSVLFRLDWRTT